MLLKDFLKELNIKIEYITIINKFTQEEIDIKSIDIEKILNRKICVFFINKQKNKILDVYLF